MSVRMWRLESFPGHMLPLQPLGLRGFLFWIRPIILEVRAESERDATLRLTGLLVSVSRGRGCVQFGPRRPSGFRAGSEAVPKCRPFGFVHRHPARICSWPGSTELRGGRCRPA